MMSLISNSQMNTAIQNTRFLACISTLSANTATIFSVNLHLLQNWLLLNWNLISSALYWHKNLLLRSDS